RYYLAIYIYTLNNRNLFIITKLFYIRPSFILVLYKVLYLLGSNTYYVTFVLEVISYILYIFLL
ncbi:hypothetical protein CCHL11_07122, partial [Colletotrichum chlorophyti]